MAFDGSPSAILTLGLGSWGSTALVLTLGYGVGVVIFTGSTLSLRVDSISNAGGRAGSQGIVDRSAQSYGSISLTVNTE